MIDSRESSELLDRQGTSGAVHEELAACLGSDSRIRFNAPMAKKTTLRVGGPADVYVEPATEADLAAIVRQCAPKGIPLFVLGRGSNLVVRDKGIRGVVIALSRGVFQSVRFDGEWVTAGAGVRLKTLAMTSRKAGVTGFEFLEGIPGTVGGAMRMNAGAMGASFFERVRMFRFMDMQGRIHEQSGAETVVHYRACELFRDCIALGAELRGSLSSVEEVSARLNASSNHRWGTQPAASSAGCMFKNPAAIPAGKLIEELGLKGKRMGGAMISEIHGNFIVNVEQATAHDVLSLIHFAREEARRRRGIELRTEVEIIGEP